MESFGIYLCHLTGTLDARSTNMSFAKKVVFSLISLITAAYICGLIMLIGQQAGWVDVKLLDGILRW